VKAILTDQHHRLTHPVHKFVIGDRGNVVVGRLHGMCNDCFTNHMQPVLLNTFAVELYGTTAARASGASAFSTTTSNTRVFEWTGTVLPMVADF
jgi:hypothetical protein